MKEYPKDVKLVFKHYPLPFHKEAHLAARATVAAQQQGKFWEMHDKLFANFRTINRDSVLAWAKELGLDVDKFTKALDDEKVKAQVDKDMAEGTKVGVSGTPTYFINGRKYNGGRDLASVKPVIEAEMKGGWKNPAPASGTAGAAAPGAPNPIKIDIKPVPAASPAPAAGSTPSPAPAKKP